MDPRLAAACVLRETSVHLIQGAGDEILSTALQIVCLPQQGVLSDERVARGRDALWWAYRFAYHYACLQGRDRGPRVSSTPNRGLVRNPASLALLIGACGARTSSACSPGTAGRKPISRGQKCDSHALFASVR